MQKKDRLRKKYKSIRQKKYFDIKPNFFDPLIKLIKARYGKKNIYLSSYYPSSYEVNVLRLFETGTKDKIKILLPVANKSNSMNFYQWNYREILKINRFGFLEPFVQLNKIIPNIMLVPLLSYDNKKNRLGYGKGFYDRYLKKYLRKNNKILTIGIAFSFQRYRDLPTSNNDVKLNFVLTEKGIF